MPIENNPERPSHKEISAPAVYRHHRKWRQDGSLQWLWEYSIWTMQGETLHAANAVLVNYHHQLPPSAVSWCAGNQSHK